MCPITGSCLVGERHLHVVVVGAALAGVRSASPAAISLDPTLRESRWRSVYAYAPRSRLLSEHVNQLDRSKLVRRFTQALERAGVHRITFHELRHTFGTRMAAGGTPMRTLKHWMDHADSKTTQIYAHCQPGDQEADAVDRAFA